MLNININTSIPVINDTPLISFFLFILEESVTIIGINVMLL